MLFFLTYFRVVADSLLQKKPVQPESFASVSVYFSDIVGFIKIGQQSSAQEVQTQKFN